MCSLVIKVQCKRALSVKRVWSAKSQGCACERCKLGSEQLLQSFSILEHWYAMRVKKCMFFPGVDSRLPFSAQRFVFRPADTLFSPQLSVDGESHAFVLRKASLTAYTAVSGPGAQAARTYFSAGAPEADATRRQWRRKLESSSTCSLCIS